MNEKVKHIIESTFLMSLATNTSDGIWVSDVIHLTDGVMPALYWISSSGAKHSKALELNSECAVSITLTQKAGEKKLGVQMQGFAHEVQGDTYNLTCLHAEKQGLPKPANVSEYCEGDAWYVFFPYAIQIFDEDAEIAETVMVLDKEKIIQSKKDLVEEGYPNPFLWFDMPGYEYPKHIHQGRVSLHIIHGSITFSGGLEKVVSAGERFDVPIGVHHTAIVGPEGCVYVVGQEIEGDA